MSRLPLLALAGIVLCALTAAGLAVDPPAVPSAPHVARLGWLVGLLCLSGGVYFASVRLVLSTAWPRQTIWLVLGVAALLRLMLLAAPPMLSTDIYRYVWDGRVQAAGINPYRYIPADPALAHLRDSTVYPHINRKEYARTIYPPASEMAFAGAGFLGGRVDSVRLVILAFEALGIGALMFLLRSAGLPIERVLIYAWNPLVLWSFASDGHVDAIAIGLTAVALALRARHRDGWAGAVLGAAVIAKFLPLVVAPALLRGGKFWRPALAGLAVIALGYAVYASAGRHVLGFLPTYGSEEGLDSGQGVWLLAGLDSLFALPQAAGTVHAGVVALGFAGLSLALLRRAPPVNDVIRLCRDAGILAGAATVAISPHYHWYFAWLALPAAVAPSWALLWLATAPLILIIDPIGQSRFLWPSLIYIPAAALLLLDLRLGRATQRALPLPQGDLTCPLRPR